MSPAHVIDYRSAYVAWPGNASLFPGFIRFAIQGAHRLLTLVVFLMVIRLGLGLMGKASPAEVMLPIAGLLADLSILIALPIALFAGDADHRAEARRLTMAGAAFLAGAIVWTMMV